MKLIKIFIVPFLAVIFVSSLFLINSCTKKTPETIKIGAILPMTGPVASLGELFKNGFEVAAEEINNQGGLKGKRVQLLIEDGAADPKTSISAFNKLIAIEKINIAITTLSGVSLALIPVSEKNNIVMFANAGHPQITQNTKYVFRHSNTATQEAKIISDHIVNHQKPEKLAIAFGNDDFGVAFKDELIKDFEKKNITITEVLAFEKRETNLRSHTTKLISKQPDGIIVIGSSKNMGLLIKQIRDFGFQGFIFSNFAFTLPDVQSLVGEAAEGVFYVDFHFNREDNAFVELNKKFHKKYNRDMSPIEILAFNTVYLIGDSIKIVGTDSDRLATHIRQKGQFNGVAEDINILPNGDILPELKVFKK